MSKQQKKRSELKREAIINAAKVVFNELGVKATSMDKLAEVAQVSKRTIYNHFSSKEELVMYLVTDLWKKNIADANYPYSADISLESQLKDLINLEIDLVNTQEYIDLSRVGIGHLFYNLEALQQEMEKLASQATTLQRWLEDAVKDKRLAIDDVEYASHQIHSLIEGSCFWPQLTGCLPLITSEEKAMVTNETVKMFLARYQTMPE